MGNVAPRLEAKEVEEYASIAAGKFSKKEIQALYEQFVQISTLEEGQALDLINEREFHLAMGFKNQNFILKRMFEVFDENGDGGITFSEFLKGLSALSTKASEQEKMKFSFRLYDVNKDGKISKSELKTMLQGSVSAFPYKFTDADLDQLVDRTFAESDLNRNGYISYAEYTTLIASHPFMLQQLTVNVSQAIQQRRARERYVRRHPENVVATGGASQNGGGASR